MSEYVEVDPGLIADFASEVEEMLGGLEAAIATMEGFAYNANPFDMGEYASFLRDVNVAELVEAFRSTNRTIHTIKGNSGFMGFTKLNRYCHTIEELTASISSGKIILSTDAYEIISRAPSIINRFLQAITETMRDEIEIEPELAEIRNCKEGLLLWLAGREVDLQKLAEADFGKIRKGGRSVKITIDLDHYDRIVQEFQSFAQETAAMLESRGVDPDTLHEVRQGMTEHLDQLVLASQSTIQLTRYPRIVKDLSRSLGKSAVFRVNQSTARARPDVWDKCHNALVHMVRNASDHGIEMPQVREKAGKPATGIIEMDVYEDHRNIYVKLVDDGKGIDPEAVAASALKKGAATAEELAKMSVEEKQKLIFKAGFSTKEETTNVSGRGVGMDAVIEEIEGSLGGHIHLNSAPGKGTNIVLEIPKAETLSDCIIFGDDERIYALPNLPGVSYVECDKTQIHHVPGSGPVFTGSGATLPILDLMEALHPNRVNGHNHPTIIRISGDGDAYGFVVPTVMGHRKLKIERKKSMREIVRDEGVVFGYALTDPVIVVLDPEHLRSRIRR